MAQNGDFARGASRGRAAPASLETVDPDPGAVFEEHGADSVDELVTAGDEPASAPADPGIEADDADVAALFGEDLEAPARTHSRGGTGDDGAGAASADDGTPADGVDELLPDRGADVLAHLEQAAAEDPAAADGSGPARDEPDHAAAPASDDRASGSREPGSEATDEDVAAALSAAEDVYEGELPEDVPF